MIYTKTELAAIGAQNVRHGGPQANLRSRTKVVTHGAATDAPLVSSPRHVALRSDIRGFQVAVRSNGGTSNRQAAAPPERRNEPWPGNIRFYCAGEWRNSNEKLEIKNPYNDETRRRHLIRRPAGSARACHRRRRSERSSRRARSPPSSASQLLQAHGRRHGSTPGRDRPDDRCRRQASRSATREVEPTAASSPCRPPPRRPSASSGEVIPLDLLPPRRGVSVSCGASRSGRSPASRHSISRSISRSTNSRRQSPPATRSCSSRRRATR